MPTASQSAGALIEAKKKLEKLNIPFCLFLGTALGAYRDGTFCPGDEDDTDLAIDIKYFDRIEEIKEEFSDWKLNMEWNPDGICPEISFKKIWEDKTYTKVDLFFITEIDGKMAWRFYLDETGREYKTKLIDKRFFDVFDEVEFFGEKFYVPGEIEEYLKANYGDWKTPIHRDNWNWQTDNQCTGV